MLEGRRGPVSSPQSKRMDSLLGGDSIGGGGMPPGMVESVLTRKTWAVSGLLSSGRVGLTDDRIRLTTWVAFFRGRIGSIDENGSTTWVLFSKGRMGLTCVNGSTSWVSLSNRRVGSTNDGIRSTTLLTLSQGRVGSTRDGIELTTLSTSSIKDMAILTT